MSLFYKNLQEQGIDFIADSLLHANDIFAKYATTSRSVASPSKLAGELLKSPVRTRTRTRDATAATGRARGAFNVLNDGMIDAADVFDKENEPLPARASRSRTASTLEPQKAKAKTKGKAIQVIDDELSSPLSRPTRRVLGDANTQKTEPKLTTQPAKTASKKSTRKNPAPDDDSMAIDAPSQADRSPDETIPRASTPPLHASPSKTENRDEPGKATQAEHPDVISVIDSDEEDSDADSDAEPTAAKAKDQEDDANANNVEPTVTSTIVSHSTRSDGTTVSFRPDTNDTVRSNDNTVSGTLIDPKLESARQAASALLTGKLQQQKDGNSEKPVKRTLASYGAKKSLPAAANNARPSNVTTTLHPASTPAGPGFRSSFLNKSLRKQIADQEALESADSESDSDDDEGGLVAGATFAALYKKTAATTQANTRANAAPASSSSSVSSKKRKSDEALPAASDADLGGAVPPHKMSKLGAAMLAAKTQSSAPTPAAKKTPAVGHASKLEQLRSTLAHVARSNGSGASSSSASQSLSSAASPALEEAALAMPPAAIPSKTLASSDESKDTHSRSSDSGSDSTEKIAQGTKSSESTIKVSAIPRSPARSPSRIALNLPAVLPPRTGSVRKSPRKLAEHMKAGQQESTLSGSPGPKVKEIANVFQSARNGAATGQQGPRSPTTQPRSLAALFGSPKQTTKLPTLSTVAGGSTTPAHSPPKNWQGSRLPFAQPFPPQPKATEKSLPPKPSEEAVKPATEETAESQRIVSAASTVLFTSKVEAAESQFFDARSRETTPEPVEAPAPPTTATAPASKTATSTSVAAASEMAAKKDPVSIASAPVVAPKASSVAKTTSLSPKKVAAKALAKAGPTSPTKASSLRAAANATSPSKFKSQASARTAQPSSVPASSASPSRTWGIGEKIKGFLGLHASTTTNPSTSVAQTKISASSTFQPRANGVPTTTAGATAAEQKAAAAAPAVTATAPAPAIPGALMASPPPAAKTPQVNSTPSSATASATINGKLTSIARAEMLRKKQVEEEERKAKEKEERRRMLMAKKEERAKAVAEEELEKENRKRAREQNDRVARSGAEDASIASSNGAPAAIPAALLGNIVVGGSATSGSVHSGATSSRTSAVSTVSSGPPTRPSSALNGSYAGVKSRYMQTSVQQQQQQQQQQSDESNKKRRVTNDKEGGAAILQTQTKQQQQQPSQPAPGARPGSSVATSQIGAPKMVRTVSQSSIRPGVPSQQQQQQQRPQPPAGAQQPPQQIKLAMKSGAAAAAGFGAAPRIPGAGATAGNGAATASMMATAGKQPQPPAKAMANANFSSSNPFQQAKQQQLQMQMQKQKQLQLQQQAASTAAQTQAAANAAAVREQELHRAAQLQFQMQNAAGGRFEEWDDAAAQQQGGRDADEALPDIASEYSDSEDEETIQKRAAMPLWTQGDALDAALLAQSTVDADEIFGIPQGPVELEKILPGERTASRIRRPRTSSANWSGPDGLAQWEIDRYNKRMGIKGAGVQLARRDGSHPPPPPPGVMARLSMAQRQSMSHHSTVATASSAVASSSTPSSAAANGGKRDDARGKP